MIYVAGVYYKKDGKIDSILYVSANEQFPVRDTASPDYEVYHNTNGLEYYKGVWNKVEDQKVSALTQHVFKELKTANEFLIRMIFE